MMVKRAHRDVKSFVITNQLLVENGKKKQMTFKGKL